MNQSWVGRACAAALAVGALVPAAAAGQARPVPQHVLSRGAAPRTVAVPAPRIVHDLSGAIEALGRTAFALRLRSGRLQRIDATDALASGRVSAPLYVGKLVDVTGSYDQRHVLHAETITRVPRVDASTPADR